MTDSPANGPTSGNASETSGAANVPSNWFTGGAEYATYRPEYPTQVSAFLAGLAPSTGTAVDVGCGTGQLSTQLADNFDRVLAFDPSESQIGAATAKPNVTYEVGRAENLPVADGTVDLVTAAQSAHWFNLPEFYAEARRIAAPGALIALVSYGVLRIADAELEERFGRFDSAPLLEKLSGSAGSTTTRSARSGIRNDATSTRATAPSTSPSRSWMHRSSASTVTSIRRDSSGTSARGRRCVRPRRRAGRTSSRTSAPTSCGSGVTTGAHGRCRGR